MSNSYRDTSKSEAAARLGRIIASESSDAGPGSAVSENYGIVRPSSSAKFKRGGAVEAEGATVRRRPDRPGKPKAYATGGAVKANRGKTNVNIIIAPQGGGAAAPAPMPVSPPMPMAGPPMPMPPPQNNGPQIPPEALAALASRAGGEPPGLIARKRGGRVPSMDAGAGSGEGRLEKADKYGVKQKK